MIERKNSKLNIYISTLNFALSFVGYQLATSIFLPLSSDIEGASRMITVPYRAFALFVSLVVIVLNWRNKAGKTSLAFKLLWIYWLALIVRIFYDTNIRYDVNPGDTQQLWLYIFGICLPAMYSVMKSFKAIDLNRALNWIFWGVTLSLTFSVFSNTALLFDSAELTGRVGGNMALNTISFGHLGVMGVILSIYKILSRSNVKLNRVIYWLILILSLLIVLRAGSRGPIVALLGVALFWLFAKGRNIVLGVFILLGSVGLIAIFIEPILSFIGDISPVMESRLSSTVYGGDSSGRDNLYTQGLDIFIENPIFGKYFALFYDSGEFYYTHNIIIDSLMGLGLIGGLVMIYFLYSGAKTSYFLIKNSSHFYWLGLILIQQIIFNMFSGAFYFNQTLNVILVFILLVATNKKQIKNV